MPRLRGLEPAGAKRPRLLILGSFPSAASLALGEYYGHERNHFWPLLALALGLDPQAPYRDRLAFLERSQVALWDVIGECEREGSLDKDIVAELPNPLEGFIGSRPEIERIALNGGKAAASFAAHLAPELGKGKLAIGEVLAWRPFFAPSRSILLSRLPSSSPVPTRSFRRAEDKAGYWRAFLG
jgi:TDG/mug DNA glycosylase family protein